MCAVLKIILANLPFAELQLRDARCQSRLQMWDVSRTCKRSQDTHGDAQEPPRRDKVLPGWVGGGGRSTGPNTGRRRCLSPRAWNRC